MAPSHILAVMGVTGAGKSSFIKQVTGDPNIKIGHSQESETKCISSYLSYIGGREIILVDTPGFDDLHLKDSEVLEMLVEWLTSTYRSGQKLNGILYLHRITDARMRGSSLRNLNMFQELIGDEFHKSVTLGTTCWSLVDLQVGQERQKELETNTTFWKIMISNGARLECIPEDRTKAQNLVYEIGSRDAIALQTQRDIVDLGKSLSSLSVAKTVTFELDELRKRQEAERKGLEEETQKRLAEEERIRQLELERIRAKNERIREHRNKQLYCSNRKPYGKCDKSGCDNELGRFQVTWHCCSCYPEREYYWHCGPCGNNCGNEEHPAMSRIENKEGCVIM